MKFELKFTCLWTVENYSVVCFPYQCLISVVFVATFIWDGWLFFVCVGIQLNNGRMLILQNSINVVELIALI